MALRASSRTEQDEILNVRAEMTRRRGRVAAAVDWAGRVLARPWLFLVLLAFHVAWVILNLRAVGGVYAWDPPPYMLLATIASALAPFVSLMVLMRQHRDARIAELREEVQLQVALHVEREVTCLVRMVDELRRGVPAEVDADALDETKKELEPRELLEHLREHLDRTEGKLE